MNVIIGKSATVFKLLSREDQALLIGWNTLFVLNLGFDIVDSIGRLHLEGDCLAGEGFDEAIVGYVSMCIDEYNTPCYGHNNIGVRPTSAL